jgi:hypothetical protein
MEFLRHFLHALLYADTNTCASERKNETTDETDFTDEEALFVIPTEVEKYLIV